MRAFHKRSRAQTVSEYMMVIAVLVITVIAVVWQPMNDAFTAGSDAYKAKMTVGAKKGVLDDNAPGER